MIAARIKANLHAIWALASMDVTTHRIVNFSQTEPDGVRRGAVGCECGEIFGAEGRSARGSLAGYLATRRTDVRNVVRVEYTSVKTGARVVVEVSDPASINQRGRLPMEIHEARLGPIDDAATAARLAESALEDLRKEKHDV